MRTMGMPAIAAHIHKILVPTLQPNQIAVPNNPSVHEASAIHDAIAVSWCALDYPQA
jgi:hypothetical protein